MAPSPASAPSRPVLLQWGHGREAMDGSMAHDAFQRGYLLQWGHGREAMDGGGPRRPCRARVRFNGAMAVRPWMAPRRHVPHQVLAASMGPWP